MKDTVHDGMVLMFKYAAFVIDLCANVKKGRRQNDRKMMGWRRKLESKEEMMERGPLNEASAARIKGGKTASMEDLISP